MRQKVKRYLSLLLIVLLCITMQPALIAEASNSQVTLRTTSGKTDNMTMVSGLLITGVGNPTPGRELDKVATVRTNEGITWEIPVLWIDEKGQMADGIAGKLQYQPVFVFFFPQGYHASSRNGLFEVRFDDALITLLGSDNLTSVYSEATGITYICIGSMAPFFAKSEAGNNSANNNSAAESLPYTGKNGFAKADSASQGDLAAYEQNAARFHTSVAGQDYSTDGYEQQEPELQGENQDGQPPVPSPVYPGGRGTAQPGGLTPGQSSGQGINLPGERGTAQPGGLIPGQSGGQGSGIPGGRGTAQPGGLVPGQSGGQGSDTSCSKSPTRPGNNAPDIVDIYCSQTARDVFSDDDLEEFLDKIINYIEPQAVEVLLEGFPAFRYGADSGQLGREIGLYVYYEKGDQDGLTAHQSTVEGGMAYVQKNVSVKDGEYFVGYIIGIDLSEFTLKDKYDLPVMDPSTGKFVLSREYTQLENTIVHEMLHAFMDDYNRVGMFGAKSPQEFLDESPEGLELYKKTTFPTWFKEGIASAVEFVYNDRNSSFSVFRYSYDLDEKKDDKGFYLENGRIENLYTKELLLKNYQHTEFRYKRSDAADAEYETSEYYYDLERSGKDSENRDVPATYVSGYLAVLYLGEMASVYSKDGSSIQYDETGKVVNVDSAKIRSGMNTILEDLHKGETLDQIINRISGGTYTSTDDFEKKFIKGASEKKELEGFVYDEYMGDSGSLDFCVKYLNFLRETELANNGESPNGSVLLPFNSLEKSVIDSSKSASTDMYQIVQSNDYVASTVPLWNDGGKSVSGSGVQSIASQNAAPAAISPERISTAAKISGDDHGEAEKNSKSAEANPENTDEETEASLNIDGETEVSLNIDLEAREPGAAEADRSSESDDKDNSLNSEGTDSNESVKEIKDPEADNEEKLLTADDGVDAESSAPAGDGVDTEGSVPDGSGKTSGDGSEAGGTTERTLRAGDGEDTQSSATAYDGVAAESPSPAGGGTSAESTNEAVSADEGGNSSDKSADGTDSSDNGENVQGNEPADVGQTPGTTGTDQAENAEENSSSGGEDQSPEPASSGYTPEPASSGYTPEPASPDDTPEPASSGYTPESASPDDTPEPASPDNTPEH